MTCVCNATDWYVDNAASGSNSGTSWTNAWRGFSNIKWLSVLPGDTIYISGGPSGSRKTYAEKLSVGTSGKNGLPITISVGKDSGHNGTVRITGTSGGFVAVNISSKNWIVIDGQSGGDGQQHIEITKGCDNCADMGIEVLGTSSNIKLRYLYVHDIGAIDNDYHCGINISVLSTNYAIGHEVSHCKVEKVIDAINMGNSGGVKPSSYGDNSIHDCYISFYDDGMQVSVSTDIYNNEIVRGQDVGQGHPDGIQIYGSYVRIYNNYFHGFLDQPGANAVIYFEPDGGNNMNQNNNQPCCYQVFNNVLNETGTPNPSMWAIMLGWSDPDWTSLSDIYILNNTIKGAFLGAIVDGWGGTVLQKANVKNYFIMNNIFYSASNGGPMWAFSTPSGSTVDYGGLGSGASIIVNNNAYVGTGSSQVGFGSRYYTYNEWKNITGAQKMGVTTLPSLNPELKPLIKNDPIVGAGYDWSNLFNTDKEGNPRPSNFWTLGAYEYINLSVEPSTLPAAPLNLRISN
jgi:hypothetical protein